MAVGFIGLGSMGSGMALNLVRAGVDLVVFDQRSESVQRLADAGAWPSESIGELARACDVIFTSLPGPRQVEEVVFGADGIAANLRPGATLIDLSTSSLELCHRIDADFASRGAASLEAPVSGGPAGAASGDLVIWVGGDREVYERHLGLLSTIASHPRHVGAMGTGTVTKLVHNLTGYMILATLAETFSLGVKAGAEPLELWQAMRLGLVGKRSPLDMLINQFLPGTYEPPAFALQLAHKDVGLATSLAKELGVPMRLANLTLEEMTEAIGRGLGSQDSRAYMKLQLERAGVEIAVDQERLRQALDTLE
jgi:3-hydroxyisobutyrate dehydrogenase